MPDLGLTLIDKGEEETELPNHLSEEDTALFYPAILEWTEAKAEVETLNAKMAAANLRETGAVAVMNFLLPRLKEKYRLSEVDLIHGDGTLERKA